VEASEATEGEEAPSEASLYTTTEGTSASLDRGWDTEDKAIRRRAGLQLEDTRTGGERHTISTTNVLYIVFFL
jgi:hypothetical protein